MPVPTVWIPPVGAKVKLKTFSDYASRDIHIWAWMRVEEIVDGRRVRVQILNGDQPIEGDNQREFPFDMIDPPLGWAPVYTIYLSKREDKDKMLEWISSGRGVAMWTSHDLSCAGRMSYAPGDVQSPHWQFTANPIEILHNPERLKFILVLSRDTKPTPQEKRKEGWKYDKSRRDWFREEVI